MTITILEAVKDNGLSNKPIVREQTLLTQMNQGSDWIILKVRLTIFNVPEQNDFKTRDRHISCGEQKNRVVVDF